MSVDPELVRSVTVWTARLTLALFLWSFVLRRSSPVRGRACRAAALAMALHLVALSSLAALAGRAPLSFASLHSAVVSLGGLAAAAIVVAGWVAWDRAWYRWAVYGPWGVFLFTYLFLPRYGDSASRIVAAPQVFAPFVLALLLALAWRLRQEALY